MKKAATHTTCDAIQPGDQTQEAYLQSLIRVNQAGEFGAKRIYAGQMAVLKRRDDAQSRAALKEIEHMAAQEEVHLDYFNKAMVARRVRPTALTPLWEFGAFALGAGTALLGTKAAMACTVAVESVIDQHYQEQLETLGEDEAELKAAIAQFREEEMEHHDTALEEGAEQAPAYPLLTRAIRDITRAAIAVSKRV